MKFFQNAYKFFGMVRAVERGDTVTVTGIDGQIMNDLLAKIFETKAINKSMFTSVTSTSLTFDRFFVPDLVFMFTKLINTDGVKWGTKRTCEKIITQLLEKTWFKVSTQEHKSMVDVKKMRELKWKPLPHQTEFLELYGERMPKYDLRGILLGAAPGTGKALGMEEHILTPKGWVRMKHIKEGDTVTTPEGGEAEVIAVYPQGVKELFEVKLVDGRRVECCLDHLWKIYSETIQGGSCVVTLQHILKNADFSEIMIPVFNEDPVAIKSITSVGFKEAQCIMINSDDQLYITSDGIVTHNTFTDFMVATCIIPPEVAEVKIIISPKKAIHLVWEKSVLQIFKKIPTYWVAGTTKTMPLKNTEYYIFNFEQLDNAIELGKSLNTRGIRYFVIVDESHNFADWRSARTQKLVKLQTIRNDIYFVWASGSPILKSAAELTSFLKCSDPRFSAQAERQFRKIYAASPGRANEIFNHRLGIMMAFLVPKSVVSKTKPKIVERPIKLPPSIAHKFLMSSVRIEMKEFIVERLKFYDGQMKTLRATVNTWLDYHETKLTTRGERKAFEQYIKDIKVISKNPDLMITEVMTRARTYERTKLLPSLPPTERKKFKSALSAIKNIKLKVRGEALGTILSKRRSECAEALALYCKPEEIMTESLSKTLFFASSVLPIQSLTDHLRKIGFNPLMVYGGTNSQLVSMMNAFDEDPNINPVCATMQSLSEAVPVTAASTVVLLNRPYRQATWDQVIARADRLGNPHPVTVIETTLDTGNEPNVSSTTDAILSNVREMISDLIGSEFGGPDPEEREYRSLIDVSEVDPTVEDIDSLMV